jgi:hypothetical protein
VEKGIVENRNELIKEGEMSKGMKTNNLRRMVASYFVLRLMREQNGKRERRE